MERLENIEYNLHEQSKIIHDLQSKIDPYLYICEWNIFVPKDIKILQISSTSLPFYYEYSIYGIFQINQDIFDEENPNHFIDTDGTYHERWKKMTIYIPTHRMNDFLLNSLSIISLQLEMILIENQQFLQNIQHLSNISSLRSLKIDTNIHHSIDELKKMIPQLTYIQCGTICQTF